jgi:uncharacterized OB-fold protein
LADYKRPIPEAVPETREFWDGLKRGELTLQRCQTAGCTTRAYFPPRPFCPGCGSRDVHSFKATGKGRLFSYVINQRPAPGFDGPYAIAVVELEEGPRMMTNIVGVEQTPDALPLDLPVELAPEPITDQVTLPKFRPAGGAR